MRAAIYCRISRDRKGANVGVTRQLAECQDLARQRGFTVVRVFTDNDLSAYSGKVRKDYRKLLELIAEGGCDVVLCWHTDRLHRAPTELETYIDTCTPRGLSTFSVQAGELDLSTPSGRMVARQLGAVARYESELRAARVQSAKVERAAAGVYSGGQRPFGFEKDGITINAKEALYINKATLSTLQGVSLSAIKREWNEDGITTAFGNQWTAQSVRDVLLRARNAGLREHQGVIFGAAQWDAIVDPETWHARRRLLTDPSRRISPGNQPKYLGAMRYRCGATMLDGSECAAPMKVTRSGPANFRIQVYVCTRQPKGGVTHVTVKRELLDEHVVSKLLSGMVEQGFSTTTQTITPDSTGVSDDIEAAQEALAAELAAGTLPVAAWKAANAQLAERRAQLDAEGAQLTTAQITGAVNRDFEDDPHGTWEKLKLDEKRALLDQYVKVTVLPATSRSRWGAGITERVRLEWTFGEE